METEKKAEFSGKVVVITGAGGILGAIFAQAFARVGGKVALLDLDLSAAEKVAVGIRAQGGEAAAYACNVLKRTEIEQVNQQIKAQFGSCDILINGAGGNHPEATTDQEFFDPEGSGKEKTFFNLSAEGVEKVFALNFLGSFLPSQVFAKEMVGKTGCSIINISSMNAFTPLTKIPAYSAAKAAISNFTQWMAVHFSRVGIRCNAIAPGFFLTGQNQALLFDEGGKPTKRAEKILTNTPAQRFGEPEELVGTMLFLASTRESGFVNGVVIPVDGGFAAYSGV